jgi:hypothetical protein
MWSGELLTENDIPMEVATKGLHASVALHPNSKISRARRASSARSVLLLARRVSSIRSALVNLIVAVIDAVIVYKWLLQAIS